MPGEDAVDAEIVLRGGALDHLRVTGKLVHYHQQVLAIGGGSPVVCSQ